MWTYAVYAMLQDFLPPDFDCRLIEDNWEA